MADEEPRPPKPPVEAGCKCGAWTWVMGHWTRTYNASCPVHGLESED